MMVEARITVAAPPATLFAIYRDVARWHEWDPDTRAANLDGPFAVGSRGFIEPARGRGVAMEVTRLESDRCFTVRGGIPGFCMDFEHELTPLPDGKTEVLHRARFSGPLSFILGRVLAWQLRRGLPVTLERLRQRAETR